MNVCSSMGISFWPIDFVGEDTWWIEEVLSYMAIVKSSVLCHELEKRSGASFIVSSVNQGRWGLSCLVVIQWTWSSLGDATVLMILPLVLSLVLVLCVRISVGDE